MENAQSILVIIVSSLLSIFLIISISVLILSIRLIKSVKKIVVKAEQVVNSAEAATDILKNAGGPLALLKIIRNIVHTVEKFRK